jgi:copper chaperone CopZ
MHRPISRVLSFLFIAFMMGCSQAPDGQTNTSDMSLDRTMDEVRIQEIETKYNYVASGEGAPVAKVMISGMSCERMCVSKVNATVAELPGIMEMDIAFDSEVEIDTLTVSFDPFEVDERDIVKAIEGIAGGEEGPSSSAKVEKLENERKSNNHRVKAQRARFSVPNIFDMLKRVTSI